METPPSPSSLDIASLISQIELTTSNVPQDEGLRQKLYDATRKLNLALESPGDTLQRFVHLASVLLCSASFTRSCALLTPSFMLQASQPACASLAHHLGIFDLLVGRGGKTMTIYELLEQTEADETLLRTCIVMEVCWYRSERLTFFCRSSHAVPCFNGDGHRGCSQCLRPFKHHKNSRSSRCPGQY